MAMTMMRTPMHPKSMVMLEYKGVVAMASAGTGWSRSQTAEENASQRSGIPGAITTAVLLRRDPGRLFTGTIEVKAERALPPTITTVFDAQHLDAVELDNIPAVVLHTSLPVAQ
ncbi:hypothetical protein An18g04950 [Aspergillus niger]|uniref:Uncharacterized protein n=2 Tax=Aspergillus niger TaxID=5061 RepID=A2RAZ9_ASPNC|nr:hypothetical protein An18g04950 [Aspergillus niger]CAK43295.1 hypothetical protein An18g04950 [Aspergillus niger]